MSTKETVTVAVAFYSARGNVLGEREIQLTHTQWAELMAGGKLKLDGTPEGTTQIVYYNDEAGETYDHSC